MFYILLFVVLLLAIIICFFIRLIKRRQAARQHRNDPEEVRQAAIGPPVTLAGVARDLGDRMFPQPPPNGRDSISACYEEDIYRGYHDRRRSGGVNRAVTSDPDLPTYVESAHLPALPSAAHTATHNRLTPATDHLRASTPTPAYSEAPPKYAPETPTSTPSADQPIVRTL